MLEEIQIEQIRNGNNEAFDELLEQYVRMIYKIIYSYDLSYGDYAIDTDDLFQEACLGLYDAAIQYSEHHGMKFSSFVYLVIKRRLNRVVRSRKEVYKQEIRSLDDIQNIDYCKSFARDVHENGAFYLADYAEEIKELVALLNQSEKAVFALRSRGFSYKEISDKLNIPIKTVDNKLTSIKRKWSSHKMRKC